MIPGSGSYLRLDVPPSWTGCVARRGGPRAPSTPGVAGCGSPGSTSACGRSLVALGVVDRQSARWAASARRCGAWPTAPLRRSSPACEASLRPYQHEGLADGSPRFLGRPARRDPRRRHGPGKTVQTLALAQRAAEAGELTGTPLLVIAPTSVVGTWVSEAAGSLPGCASFPSLQPINGAECLARDHRRGRCRRHVIRAVADRRRVVPRPAVGGAGPRRGAVRQEPPVEDHQAARRVGASFTLAITGTPLENSLVDLWSMSPLAAPGLYPSPERFTRTYRRPIESGERPERLTGCAPPGDRSLRRTKGAGRRGPYPSRSRSSRSRSPRTTSGSTPGTSSGSGPRCSAC